MTDLTYSVTRQQAADMLGVSTRSIDRYVKGGKLSYKKIANKVLLAREEVTELQSDYNLLHQNSIQETVVVKERAVEQPTSNKVTRVNSTLWAWSVKEFSDILTTKDKVLEEKNQMIYALQRKIGEIETKMGQMIALPDYSVEKENMKLDIQKLELEKRDLKESIKKEKLMNTIFLGLALVAVLFVFFFTLR